MINRFDGVDIAQTIKFIKVYNKTYIEIIFKAKDQLDYAILDHGHPAHVRMHSGTAVNKVIEQAKSITDKELKGIEKETSFSCKQGIGELIYAMVTC